MRRWNGRTWRVVATPDPGTAGDHLPAVPGSANWSNLYGVAVSGGSVYVTGTFVNPATWPAVDGRHVQHCYQQQPAADRASLTVNDRLGSLLYSERTLAVP